MMISKVIRVCLMVTFCMVTVQSMYIPYGNSEQVQYRLSKRISQSDAGPLTEVLFRKADLNNDGYLTKGEVKYFYKAYIGFVDELARFASEALVRKGDQNHDNRINPAETLSAMRFFS